MAEGSPSTSNPKTVLQRNQACSHCHRRKIRCDGQQPVCGPCVRGHREEDCEYTANIRRSRAEILEEDIRRIQTRIHHLEDPGTAKPSIPLRNPYAQVRIPGIYQVLDAPAVPAPPGMPTESEPPLPTMPGSWWNSDEPPRNMAESLLDTFLPYAADWGFFLHVGNFRRDALLPLPIGDHSRPSPALLAAVYLVGITLSASPTLKMHEKTFLARALSALPSSLSGLHPRKALHALQAEIVLATYFFSAGKFVECLYHTAAAVSLAVSSGLHETFAEAPGMLSGPHATDSEESERFNACLAILTLDKAWAVALGTPSNWNDTLLAPESLETGYDGDGANDISPKTLLANAVVLWERANSLAVRWDPEMSVQDSHEFFSKFSILDERIDNFRRAVTTFSAESLDARALVVVYSIAHTATIQLHAPFKNNEVSHRKTVDAATAVLIAAADTANLVDCVFINPIVVPVWATAGRVVVEEIRMGRGDGELTAVYERGFTAMCAYSRNSPLMYYHVQKAQEDSNAQDGDGQALNI